MVIFIWASLYGSAPRAPKHHGRAWRHALHCVVACRATHFGAALGPRVGRSLSLSRTDLGKRAFPAAPSHSDTLRNLDFFAATSNASHQSGGCVTFRRVAGLSGIYSTFKMWPSVAVRTMRPTPPLTNQTAQQRPPCYMYPSYPLRFCAHILHRPALSGRL